jgi:hypothetical protein
MDVAIVYESMFGNTRSIAEAIAGGVRAARPDATVSVRSVSEAVPEEIRRAALVVVGGPTHLRGMSTQSSRRRARRRVVAAVGAREDDLAPGGDGLPGVREWLPTVPQATGQQSAAAFDTRLPELFAGGAAPRIARALERSGYRVVTRPVGFEVTGAGVEPILRAGERDRARAWGTELGALLGDGPGR